MCLNGRNFEYPTASYTREKIDAVSVRLFAIAERHTWTDPDDPEAQDYENQFHSTRLTWPESEPFWTAIGWDISDGRGNELNCAYLFARQIIAVTGGLVDGAVLSLSGGAMAAYDDNGELIDADRRWCESLEEEAAQYLQSKGGFR